MELDFYPNEIINRGYVKLRIEAVGGDLDRVVCRYPRSFLDEMARQLTDEIENALGVEGLADSSVELVMSFAPNTYLEHISENVTYRRLMLMDKVSAPRDFWVKWTRLAGEIIEYHSGNIRFELGEDVEQKIREREYRYLLASEKESYHNSMGRKKVTEWREVVKRAAKRGELTKIESDFELTPETLELEARIANLLGKKVTPIIEPKKEEIPYVHADENEFELALAKMREVVESTETEEETENAECRMQNAEFFFDDKDEAEEIEQAEEEEEADEELLIFEEITPPETENGFEIEEETMENAECGMQNAEFAFPDEDEVEETEESKEEIIENAECVMQNAELETEAVEILAEPVVEEMTEPVAELVEEPIGTPIADRAAYIRAEIEAKIRLEYESKARIKAEEELIALRLEYHTYRTESEALLADAQRELERLRLEYGSFIEETRRRETQRRAAEAQRIAEEKELRAQIEIQLRQEAQERERLEQAARMAIEEQRRLEQATRMAIEEQRRLEAENARIALQRQEQERIEAENRRRIEAERSSEAIRQAEAERIRREEEEERAKAAMPEMGDSRYAYTSKAVKLLFRRSVDPNITTRIHEIIKATVEYYGKDNVYLKIKAMVTDSQTVVLEFEQIPLEEMALLGNIIKILGNSGLGIAKAIIE